MPAIPVAVTSRLGSHPDTTMRASAFNIAWEFLLGPFIMDGVQGWVKKWNRQLGIEKFYSVKRQFTTGESPSSHHGNVKDRSPSTPYNQGAEYIIGT